MSEIFICKGISDHDSVPAFPNMTQSIMKVLGKLAKKRRPDILMNHEITVFFLVSRYTCNSCSTASVFLRFWTIMRSVIEVHVAIPGTFRCSLCTKRMRKLFFQQDKLVIGLQLLVCPGNIANGSLLYTGSCAIENLDETLDYQNLLYRLASTV